MMNLCCNVLAALKDRTLATAESCTGGMIGAAVTAVAGSSAVYKGGIISYTNQIKQELLGIDKETLDREGAVSSAVALAMALGAREKIGSDVAVSTTGLAGPSGDTYGNPVGTVYIGYADVTQAFSEKFVFCGDRNAVREQAVRKALEIIIRESGTHEGPCVY